MKEAILTALRDRAREIATEGHFTFSDIEITREDDLIFFDLTITASLDNEDLKNIYGLEINDSWDS